MKKNKSEILINIILILVAIVFTILVKVIDIQLIATTETELGFATINNFIFETLGQNEIWYNITDLLGILSIFIAFAYAIIGVIQLIKRKSLLKIDKEIIALGIFYIIVISIYVLFEKIIINYRPILIDGVLEASYPSSHTLMSICLCGSSIIINKKLFDNKFFKYLNIVSVIIILVMVIGRLLSGVHWFTDIVGGIIISAALLSTLNTVINSIKSK